MNSSAKLRVIQARLRSLSEDRSTSNSDKIALTTELQRLQRDAEHGQLCPDDWQDHELNWTVHLADLRNEVMRRSAHVMLAFEDMRRKDPSFGIGDTNFEELLHWWRNENGREEFLGELPIAERRDLEAKAAEWERRDEGSY